MIPNLYIVNRYNISKIYKEITRAHELNLENLPTTCKPITVKKIAKRANKSMLLNNIAGAPSAWIMKFKLKRETSKSKRILTREFIKYPNVNNRYIWVFIENSKV